MAAALWAEVAPAKTLAPSKLRPGIDYTVATYAAQFGISEANARHYLALLIVPKDNQPAKFTRGLYRLRDTQARRQPQYVYWPVAYPAPDEVGK